MNYYEKYLKYKQKYIELKNQSGSSQPIRYEVGSDVYVSGNISIGISCEDHEAINISVDNKHGKIVKINEIDSASNIQQELTYCVEFYKSDDDKYYENHLPINHSDRTLTEDHVFGINLPLSELSFFKIIRNNIKNIKSQFQLDDIVYVNGLNTDGQVVILSDNIDGPGNSGFNAVNQKGKIVKISRDSPTEKYTVEFIESSIHTGKYGLDITKNQLSKDIITSEPLETPYEQRSRQRMIPQSYSGHSDSNNDKFKKGDSFYYTPTKKYGIVTGRRTAYGDNRKIYSAYFGTDENDTVNVSEEFMEK